MFPRKATDELKEEDKERRLCCTAKALLFAMEISERTLEISTEVARGTGEPRFDPVASRY